LYVTDYNRVQKFTIDGNCLLRLGKYGSDDADLYHPEGLTVHNGKVYVADSYNSRISVFYTNCTFHQTIGKGQLDDPTDVAVTSNNELLVVDQRHYYIYRFTLDGDYVN